MKYNKGMTTKGMAIKVIEREQTCVVCKKKIARLSIVYYAFLYRNSPHTISSYICSSECLAKTKSLSKRKGQCHQTKTKFEKGISIYYVPTQQVGQTNLLLSEQVGNKWVEMDEEEKIKWVRQQGDSRSQLRLKEKEGDPKVLAYQEKKKKKEEKFLNPVEEELLDKKWVWDGYSTLKSGSDFVRYYDKDREITFSCWWQFPYALRKERAKKLKSLSTLDKFLKSCYNNLAQMKKLLPKDVDRQEFMDFVNENSLFWKMDFGQLCENSFGCTDVNLWITDPSKVKRVLAKVIYDQEHK